MVVNEVIWEEYCRFGRINVVTNGLAGASTEVALIEFPNVSHVVRWSGAARAMALIILQITDEGIKLSLAPKMEALCDTSTNVFGMPCLGTFLKDCNGKEHWTLTVPCTGAHSMKFSCKGCQKYFRDGRVWEVVQRGLELDSPFPTLLPEIIVRN